MPMRLRPSLEPCAVAVAACFLCAFVAACGGGSKSSENAPSLTQKQLESLAKTVGHPVYWAGAMADVKYEVTRLANGRIFIRYLPSSEQAGTSKKLLTVGTYPLASALALTKAASKRPGAVALAIGGNGAAFYLKSHPQSIFFAFPGLKYQMEIYDPVSSKALAIFKGGKVAPVPGSQEQSTATTPAPTTATKTVAVLDAKGLKTLAAALKRPLYWVGPRPGVGYQLTQTTGGAQMYVRYLPKGVPRATKKPYLTVGTYFVKNAAAVTTAASKQKGATPVAVAGGIAYVPASQATSVIYASPGSPYQVEVFDPKPGKAKSLVKSGKLATVK
jgi:hypothetical protein